MKLVLVLGTGTGTDEKRRDENDDVTTMIRRRQNPGIKIQASKSKILDWQAWLLASEDLSTRLVYWTGDNAGYP